MEKKVKTERIGVKVLSKPEFNDLMANHKIDDKNDIDVKLELIDEGKDMIFAAKVYTDEHIAKKVKIKVDKVNFI